MSTPSRSSHRVSTEPLVGRVQVRLGDLVVADSRRALVLHETGLPDAYYLPQDDVRMDLLEPTEHHTHCPYKGDAAYWSIKGPGRVVENAVWSYPDPLPEMAAIRGRLSFYRDRVDRIEVQPET